MHSKNGILIYIVAVCLCTDDKVPQGRHYVDVELREHCPAASSSHDTYTLLKFYNLSKDLVKTVLRVHISSLLRICECVWQSTSNMLAFIAS